MHNISIGCIVAANALPCPPRVPRCRCPRGSPRWGFTWSAGGAFPCRITFVSHCVRFHCLQAAQSLPITVCVHCVRVHCRQVARQTLNPVWNAQYTLTVENLATPLIIEAFVSRAHDTWLLAVFACQSFLSIAADL